MAKINSTKKQEMWKLQKPDEGLECNDRERKADFESTIELLRDEITDRISAEKTLKESEELLSAFMNSATDAFSLWDSELNLIRINNAGIKLIQPGTLAQEIIGKNITDLIPDVKDNGRLDLYRMVIKNGGPYYSSDIFTNQKFGLKYINIEAFRVSKGLGLILRDITGRKLAESKLINTLEESKIREAEISSLLAKRKLSEEALKNSRETLKLAQELANIGSWVW